MIVLTLLACSLPPIGWPAPDAPVEDALRGGGTLCGGVLGVEWGAVVGARVTTAPLGFGAITDGRGAFRIEHLPPDGYTLVVAHDGWEVHDSTEVEVAAGAESTAEVWLEPSIPADGWVQVDLTGPDGLPLAGAVVRASTGAMATTDASGRAELHLAPGPFDLDIGSDGLWGRTFQGLVLGSGNLQLAAQLSGRPSAGASAIGSRACGGCHLDIFGLHGASAHGQAASDAPAGDVLAAFDAVTVVDLAVGSATLGWNGPTPTVTLTSASYEVREFEVTGFVGRQETGTVPWTDIAGQGYPLPIAWVGDDPTRPGFPGPHWLPFEVETWLDGQGAFTFPIGQRPPPARSADARCFACHTTGWTIELRPDDSVELSATVGDGRWNDAHVGCERCHGPGSSHFEAEDVDKPRFIVRPDRLDPARANEVCGQCHASVHGIGTALPFPFSALQGWFLPGDDLGDFAVSTAQHWPSGVAAAPNQQFDERMLSPHETGLASLRCIDCHDPHGGVERSLRVSAQDNTLCASCHDGLNFTTTSAEDHTGHLYDPAGPTESGRCIGCHMAPTASRLSWTTASGAGDLSSHLFMARPPADTLDAFDAASEGVLLPGQYPIHGCSDCHVYNASLDPAFTGPAGDPSLRGTHVEHQAAFEGMFP